MISAVEADHRRNAVVDIRRIGDSADSQELEEDDVLGGNGVVELGVSRLPADTGGIDRRVIHHREAVAGEEAQRQVAGGSRPAGIAANQGLEVDRRPGGAQGAFV